MKEQLIVPVFRINNRRVNLAFFVENLGLKTVLEEGAFVELAGHTGSKIAQIVLVESPSMRTRAVQGVKKHRQTVLKVENPAEIEYLLARGASFEKLYKGVNGFAFESVSPEGDRFFLHAEETIADLQEVESTINFTGDANFVGLTNFVVSEIEIHTPDVAASQSFYDGVLPNQTVLQFREAAGADLLCEAGETWDLESIRITVPADVDWTPLKEQLTVNYFIDKKETFLQTTDPSHIEVWFEK
ncbi:CppA N-terminal domain-containing protein [Streptococcus ovis]|uniref:CppA N-terminal domain-containing protein n=1 Tax=Streptococcus ovis TaxID=82806 RepID=UPI00035C3B3E|nr:CppA N-terminal domain-containing protein [Streptococcus ovis]